MSAFSNSLTMNLPDEVYYFDTYVAGRLYGDADKAWDALRVGQALQLRREPDNEHDPWAVAVYVALSHIDYKLGYLPLRSNQPLALLIDMGWGEAFAATISRLDAGATYDRQIGLTVRIVRRKKPAKRRSWIR